MKSDADIAISISTRDEGFKSGMRDVQNEVNRAVLGIERRLNSAGNAIKAVLGAKLVYEIGQVGRSFIETASQVEKMDLMLTQVTGSAAAAKQSFDWIIGQGQKAFGVESVSDAFVKFRAVGIDPTTKSLIPLMDALSAFGKNTPQDLREATNAISQIAGKGVVQMEELRQQLGERLPTAIKIMARELGISVNELFEMTRKGTLSAQKGLDALFTGLAKDYGGMTDKMGNTWQGLMNRTSTAWFLSRKEVMESEGLFNIIKEGVSEFLEEIQKLKREGKLKEWAKDIALAVIGAFEAMINAAQLFGVALNNVKSAWASVQVFHKEMLLADLQDLAKMQSALASKKDGMFGFLVPPDISDRMEKNVREQEKLTAEIAELQKQVWDPQNANTELIVRLDGLRERLNNIRDAANNSVAPTDAAAAAMGMLGQQTEEAGNKTGAAAVGINDIDRALDRMTGHAVEASQALADVTFELEQTIRRNSGQILEADIEDAKKAAQEDIADIWKIIQQAEIDFRELEQKLTGKTGATPEALAELEKAQAALNKTRKDGLDAQQKIAEALGITVEQLQKVGDAQKDLNVAKLNEEYTDLTGTLQEQLLIQNQRLEAELQLRLAQNQYLSEAEKQLDIAIVKEQKRLNALRATGSFWDGMRLGFSELSRTMETSAMIGERTAADISDAFGSFFDDIFDDSKTAEDAFESFMNNIKDIFFDAIADMMKQQFIEPLFKQIFSGLSNTSSLPAGLTGYEDYVPPTGGGGLLSGISGIGSLSTGLSSLLGSSMLSSISSVLGPVGLIASAIGLITSLFGGDLFGEEEPPAAMFGMKFGKNMTGAYSSSKYNFGSWTENFEDNGMVPGPLQAQAKKYFEDTLYNWEKMFHFNAKEVFEKWPAGFAFEVTEDMDVIKVAASSFIKAYGLAFANEIAGFDFVQLFDTKGITAGLSEDEAMDLIMGKGGNQMKKDFRKWIKSLKNKGESRTETFERVMDTLGFFPDLVERINEFTAKGWSKTDAANELERLFAWYQENIIPGFQNALASAMESEDFSDFENVFAGTVESVFLAGFEGVNTEGITDSFLTVFGDIMDGAKDLIDQYYRGDIDFAGFQTGTGNLLADFQGRYDEFAPIVEEFDKFQEEYTKFLEDLLGITEQKYNDLTESLTDIIETAGMTDFEKQVRELDKQHEDWIEQATKLGAAEGDPIWQLIEDAYKALFDQIETGAEETADTLGELADMMKSYRDIIATSGMSAEGQSLYDLTQSYADQRAEIEALGLSASDLSAALAELDQAFGIEKQVLIDGFLQPIKDIIATAGLSDLGAQLYQLNQAYNEQVRAAQDLGISLSEVNQAYDLQRQAIIDQFVEPLQEIVNMQGMSDYEKQLYALDQWYTEQAKTAAELGQSLDLLNQAYAVQRDEIDQQRQEQVDAFTQGLSSIIDTQGMSEAGKSIYQLNQWYEEQRDIAEELGQSLDMLNQAYDVQAQSLIDQFLDPLQAAIDTAGLTDLGQQMYALNQWYEEQAQVAADLGVSLDLLNQAYAVQQQALIDQYTKPLQSIVDTAGMSDYEQQLYNLSQWYEEQAQIAADLGQSLDLLNQAYAVQLDVIEEQRQAQIDAYQDSLSAIIDTQGMTEVQKQIYQLNKWYEEQAELAEDLGQSLDSLNQAYDVQMQDLVDQFTEPLQKIIDTAGMEDVARQMWELDYWLSEQLVNAKALGQSTSKVYDAYNLQVEDLVRKMMAPLEEIVDTQGMTDYGKQLYALAQWFEEQYNAAYVLPGNQGDYLYAAYDIQLQEIIDSFIDPIQEIVDSGLLTDLGKQIYELNKWYEEQYQIASELPGEQLPLLDEAYAIQLGKIIDQFMEPLQKIVDTSEMTDLGKSLYDLQEWYDELFKTASEIPVDEANAQLALLNEAYAAQLANLTEQFTEPLTDIIESGALTDVGNQVRQLTKWYEDQSQVATELGQSLDLVNEAYDVQLQTLIDSFVEPLQEIVDTGMLTDLGKQLYALTKWYEEQRQMETELPGGQLSILNEAYATQLADIIEQFTKPIDEIIATNGLTDAGKQIRQLNEWYAEQKQIAEELGQSIDGLNQALAIQQEEIVESFTKPLLEIVDSGLLTDLGNQLRELNQWYEEQYAIAKDLPGEQLTLLDEAFATQFDAIIKQFTDPIDQIISDASLSEAGKQIASLNDWYAEQALIAGELGQSLDSLNQAFEIQQEQIVESFVKPIQEIVDSGLLTDLGNQVRQLNVWYEEQYQIAKDLPGEQLTLLDAAYETQLQQIVSQLTDPLQEIVDTAGMDETQKALYELQKWYDELYKTASELPGAQLGLLDEAYAIRYQEIMDDYAEQIVSVWESMLDSLQDTYDQVRYGSLNPSYPTEKAATARQDYASLFQQALGGGEEAIREYQGFFQDYLQMQRDVFKSSLQYQQIYASAMQDYEMIQAIAAANAAMPPVPQFADGGVSSGPTSGYLIESHGIEAHVPLKNGYIPVSISGGSKGDSEELKKQNALLEEQNRLLRAILAKEGKPATINVDGKSFAAYVRTEADGVRVEGHNRKMGSRRMYPNAVS